MSPDFESNAEPPPSPIPLPSSSSPRALPVQGPTEVPRRRRSPLAVLSLSFVAFGSLVAMVVGGWLVWAKQEGNQRPVDLAEEREIERKEAATTFLDPMPPTPEEAQTFAAFFDDLGNSLATNEVSAVEPAFDGDRILRELAVAGILQKMDPHLDHDFPTKQRREMIGRLARALVVKAHARWNSTVVQRVTWSEDRSEARVIALHRRDLGGADEITSFKICWWLIARKGTLKIYDLAFPNYGYRITPLMGQIDNPEFAKNHVHIVKKTTNLYDAIDSINSRDLEKADQNLSAIHDGDLPETMMAAVNVWKAYILVERNLGAEAFEKCDVAEKQNPDLAFVHWVRADAYFRLGRYEDSIASARKYRALLGSDPDASLIEGLAFEMLGKATEALAACRAALDEKPDFPKALDCLRRLLPPTNKSELADRIARTRDPKTACQAAMYFARLEGDLFGIASLVEGLRRRFPNDYLVFSEDMRSHIHANRFKQAQEVLVKGLQLAEPGDRISVRNSYLLAMMDKGKTLEAYAAMLDEDTEDAFRLLANSLRGPTNDDPLLGPTGADADKLRSLIAAHRKRRPGDAWLWYFDAVLLLGGKDFAGAERLFATGAENLSKTVVDRDREQFRDMRFECYYRMEKGLEAYQAMGQTEKLFQRLADRYLQGEKLDDLKKLIDAHEKQHPDGTLVWFWRGEWHFAKAEYPAAVKAYRRFRDDANDDSRELSLADYRLARCLLRTGRVAEAHALDQSLKGERKLAPVIRAAIAAARNDVSGVDRLMGEYKSRGDYDYFYDHEDFVRETAGPMFDSIRAKYPPPKKQPAKPDT